MLSAFGVEHGEVYKAGRKDTIVMRQPADTDIYPRRARGQRSPTNPYDLTNRTFVNGKRVHGDEQHLQAHNEAIRRKGRWAKVTGAYEHTEMGEGRVGGKPAKNAAWVKSKYVPVTRRPRVRAAGKVGAVGVAGTALAVGGYAAHQRKKPVAKAFVKLRPKLAAGLEDEAVKAHLTMNQKLRRHAVQARMGAGGQGQSMLRRMPAERREAMLNGPHATKYGKPGTRREVLRQQKVGAQGIYDALGRMNSKNRVLP